MEDFREKVKDGVDIAREKAKDAIEGAFDITRDKLDTFRKLDKTGQQIVLAVIGVLAVVIISWLFWPRSLDVTVVRIVEPVVGNSVVISNHTRSNLGKTVVILNDDYETTIDDILPDETKSLFVTEFHVKGNPQGSSPGKDVVPRKVTVRTRKGTFTQKFFSH
jgi:hypothetical protein